VHTANLCYVLVTTAADAWRTGHFSGTMSHQYMMALLSANRPRRKTHSTENQLYEHSNTNQQSYGGRERSLTLQKDYQKLRTDATELFSRLRGEEVTSRNSAILFVFPIYHMANQGHKKGHQFRGLFWNIERASRYGKDPCWVRDKWNEPDFCKEACGRKISLEIARWKNWCDKAKSN